MIDTIKLEELVDAINSDPKAIHAMVKKVGKEPESWTLCVLSVDTMSDKAVVRLYMKWDATHLMNQVKAYDTWEAKTVLRWKWLVSLIERVQWRAEKMEWPIGLNYSIDDFEFGLLDGEPPVPGQSNPLSSNRTFQTKIWASTIFEVFEGAIPDGD